MKRSRFLTVLAAPAVACVMPLVGERPIPVVYGRWGIDRWENAPVDPVDDLIEFIINIYRQSGCDINEPEIRAALAYTQERV